MSEHTPGPWHYHEQGEASSYAITHHNDRRKEVDWLLALQHNGEQPTAEQKANMRLIAAAPELLEVVKEITELFVHISDENLLFDWQRSARNILAKAKGEKS